MRRWLVLLTLCLVLGGVAAVPVSAETAASSVDFQCSVTAEGDCLVTMMVTLRMEAAVSELSFPLPSDAKNITLNGSSVGTTKTVNAVNVDVSRIVRDYVGEASVQFSYTIPEAVKVVKINEGEANEERVLQLQIPILCGFEYPVESLSFTINLPSGELSDQPEFTSIYRQSSMASDLNVLVNGNQIIGSSKVALNDRDGVTMTMYAPQEMFPTISTYIREGNPELVPMLICAGAALIYWLIFLSGIPAVSRRAYAPPEGLTAGELGCRLTHSGADLTAMVFTWAQLGYILIQLDGNGRVLLHKRMDMGNERGPFENKVFRWLFSTRSTVDGTGYPYADLTLKVAKLVPSEKTMYKTNSGNIKIFRFIACASHVFCGICVAMNMTTVAILQVVLAVFLGIFGAVSAWFLQNVAYRTHLRGKVPVYIGFGCLLAWVILGLFCGQVWIPLCGSLGQWALGYLAAYGGRRSDLGKYEASTILGLRRYLKRMPRGEISRLLKNDPDYFFNMAPYALALGVIRPFSLSFGRRMLDQCPYLMTQVHGKRTAEEWGDLMASVADLMDTKSRQMQLERLLSVQVTYQPRRPRPAPARRKIKRNQDAK